MHALICEPTKTAIAYLKKRYDRVFTCPKSTLPQAIARWHDAIYPVASRTSEPYYAAVLTWNPYRVPLVKTLALLLGAPVVPLGTHSFHEGEKFKIRDILLATHSAGSTPYMNIRSEEDLLQVGQGG